MTRRGLSELERRILLPGPPGEGPFPDVLFQTLVVHGRARWNGAGVFEVTELGELALRVCPFLLVVACSGAPFEARPDAAPVEASPLGLGVPESAPSSGGEPGAGGHPSSGGRAEGGASSGGTGSGGAALPAGGASSSGGASVAADASAPTGGAVASSGGASSAGGGPASDCPRATGAAFVGVCGPTAIVLYPCSVAPAGCVMHAGIVCCP